VVAAASVAGGVTVVGVKGVGIGAGKEKRGPSSTQNGRGTGGIVHSERANHASARGLERGKAIARGQTGTTPPGLVRRAQKKVTHKAQGAGRAARDTSRGSRATKTTKEVTAKKPVAPSTRASGKPDRAGKSDSQSADSTLSGATAAEDLAPGPQNGSHGNSSSR
jgi:hypothetical protein